MKDDLIKIHLSTNFKIIHSGLQAARKAGYPMDVNTQSILWAGDELKRKGEKLTLANHQIFVLQQKLTRLIFQLATMTGPENEKKTRR